MIKNHNYRIIDRSAKEPPLNALACAIYLRVRSKC